MYNIKIYILLWIKLTSVHSLICYVSWSLCFCIVFLWRVIYFCAMWFVISFYSTFEFIKEWSLLAMVLCTCALHFCFDSSCSSYYVWVKCTDWQLWNVVVFFIFGTETTKSRGCKPINRWNSSDHISTVQLQRIKRKILNRKRKLTAWPLKFIRSHLNRPIS